MLTTTIHRLDLVFQYTERTALKECRPVCHSNQEDPASDQLIPLGKYVKRVITSGSKWMTDTWLLDKHFAMFVKYCPEVTSVSISQFVCGGSLYYNLKLMIKCKLHRIDRNTEDQKFELIITITGFTFDSGYHIQDFMFIYNACPNLTKLDLFTNMNDNARQMAGSKKVVSLTLKIETRHMGDGEQIYTMIDECLNIASCNSIKWTLTGSTVLTIGLCKLRFDDFTSSKVPNFHEIVQELTLCGYKLKNTHGHVYDSIQILHIENPMVCLDFFHRLAISFLNLKELYLHKLKIDKLIDLGDLYLQKLSFTADSLFHLSEVPVTQFVCIEIYDILFTNQDMMMKALPSENLQKTNDTVV
ncbi:hypothetical protein AB4K20DRAFT_1971253 [Rhizopus microsporus]